VSLGDSWPEGAHCDGCRTFRDEVADGDIIVIATGPNEIEQAFEEIQDGTCGGEDDMACVDELHRTWERDFDAILDEIETLRDGRPTAIRVVNAANAFIDLSFSREAARGIAAIFEALTQVLCDDAEAHGAVCVDVRPVLNGPDLNQPVNDSSQGSMDAVAELLVQAGVPELE
jgi:hypothetical protein